MDYEKKYNEALKWMRELYPGLHGATKEDAEHYFPELRESEDERIRMALIELLKEVAEDETYTGRQHIPDMLSYLEKQKEQKPAEWSEEDNKRMDAVIELLENTSAIHPNYSHRKLIIWLNDLRKQPKPDCNGCAKHLEGYISGRSDAENKLLDGYGILWMPDGELRIKPRWRPSEEQMSMLRAVINDPNNSGAESCQLALRGIYEQLKKL